MINLIKKSYKDKIIKCFTIDKLIDYRMLNRDKILLFVPVYNCEKQILRVLDSISPDIAERFAEVVVIENRSTDGTLKSAKHGLSKIKNCKVTLLQNDENYSLGGSHKVAFNYMLEHGYDYLVVLHGDDQGDIQVNTVIMTFYWDPDLIKLLN